MERLALFLLRIRIFTLFLLAACYAISDEEFDARMDRDGDGIPGTEDCDDHAADVGTDWYQDLDGDGYGTSALSLDDCEEPTEQVAPQTGDCDDGNAEVNPDAEEVCDNADNNCDGETDEDFDLDGDDHLDETRCNLGDDCNDADGEINPDANEVCDDADNDCDGDTDEEDAVDAGTWYEDQDQDAYGNPDTAVTSCERPSRYADNGNDCDDEDVTAYPGSPETCDGVDDDCDELVDEDFDVDGDGYQSEEWCADQGGEDCDDADNSTYPGAPDSLGDNTDQDCDGYDG